MSPKLIKLLATSHLPSSSLCILKLNKLLHVKLSKCFEAYQSCGRALNGLICDGTVVLAVVKLSAPATTATHSQVIPLHRVLTEHHYSRPSMGPTSVTV